MLKLRIMDLVTLKCMEECWHEVERHRSDEVRVLVHSYNVHDEYFLNGVLATCRLSTRTKPPCGRSIIQCQLDVACVASLIIWLLT